MPLKVIHFALVVALMSIPTLARAESSPPPTTREQTIRLVPVAPGTTQILPRNVSLYAQYGYSAFAIGPGEDQGRKFDLMPAGYVGSPNVARLVSYFSISDVHITDKESPAEGLYFGWNAPFQAGGLLSQAYSPVVLSTTQVLDSTVRTINALHRQAPFDFGLALGDEANSSQFNELRWFIDVMDGKYITPSSGANLGASSVDYQKPFQAAGLDPSIPWYQVVGNHDQFWMGIAYPSDKVRSAEVNGTVLNMGTNILAANATESSGVYVGVVDGSTPLGDVIKGGPATSFAVPPTVVPDENRRSVTTASSSTRDFIAEFFNTTSAPVGHGFNPAGSGKTAACYTFEPLANLPLKVIVLDDTCKSTSPSGGAAYYGSGWIDEERYAWLTNELQKGQDAEQLMILACHIPINPQKDLFDPTPLPQFYPASYQSDAQLIATLHRYPNLILLIAGHRHMNAVTPQPSPDAAHPEYGFWEVETSSLRDFPRQFRTFDIRRNRDNSVSILTTNVDPQVEAGTPAAASLEYAIGAYRIFGNGPLADATSHAYNAELVKPLSPAMQAKIARYGEPLEPHELRVVNASTLGRIDGTHPLVAGFVIENRPRRVLIRAVGPGLDTNFGLKDYAADPQITLNRIGAGAGVVDRNDNWNGADAAIMAQVGAFSLAPASRDAAMVLTLTPGVYTATVSSADGHAGSALVELYDVDPSIPGSLVNFSTRGWIAPGESLTPGIVTIGSGTILARAVGPGLAPFGLPNVVADPRLDLWPHGANQPAGSNDDWSSTNAAVMARLGAFPLAAGSQDAALVFRINGQDGAPQLFTLQASAPVADSGECLVETYLVK